MRTTARRCDRAREYASLRLDGELSDFESALLDSHIERCPSCRAFAEDLVGVTERLRTEPLERPLIVLTLPQRRFAALRTMQASAAAAAVVSVVGIGALFGMLHSNASAPGRVARLGSMAQEKREFRDLRRAILTAPHPERQPGGLGNLSV
ncbi:MAG TPA: zf-HC2 domain-containing protein [Gaiellaceae bacterium]|nr:zf-HC2 domain-containing protein [Gaiellaceae bacterium]